MAIGTAPARRDNYTRRRSLAIGIVGAGCAGLTTAYLLAKFGYENVTLFEGSEAVGGKVSSHTYRGKRHDMGATWAVSAYRLPLEMARHYGIRTKAIPSPRLRDASGEIISMPRHARRRYSRRELLAGVGQLVALSLKYPAIRTPTMVGDLELLSRPTHEVMAEYPQLEALLDTHQPVFEASGYGDLTVPALYHLRMLYLVLVDVLVSRARSKISPGSPMFVRFEGGFGRVYEMAAKNFDVRVRHEVDAVVPCGDGSGQIELRVGHRSFRLDRLIVTAPPHRAARFLDVPTHDLGWSRRVRTSNFVSTLAQVTGLPDVSPLVFLRDEGLGTLLGCERQHADEDVRVFYQQVPAGQARERTNAELERGVAHVGGRLGAVIHQRSWDYFPRLGSDDLRGGIIADMEARQGRGGIYFAGSFLSHETVFHVTEHVAHLVSTHFGPAFASQVNRATRTAPLSRLRFGA